MAKFIKYIALTRTPTTHIICIPAKAVRDMNIEEDTEVQVEYDNIEKILTITKIKGE